MSGEILFLAHRVPFPPDRGDKIRSHHVLKALAALAPVHVGTLGETEQDMAQDAELAQLAASHCLVHRTTPLPLAGLEAVATRQPVSLTAFHHARLARWVRQVCATRPVAAIYVYSGQMGQYVPREYRGRVVTDLVDVDSLKFESYADESAWPRSTLYRREARMLAREEARLAALSHRTLLVSEAEAELLRGRIAAGPTGRVQTLRNGTDTAFFDPADVIAKPEIAGASGPHLVFTGQMDYPPNVTAGLRGIDAILPRIRRRFPDATLHIVGRAPVASLRVRDGEPGVRVWGEVPDIRPYLAAADLVITPLTIARGVQNKVLEAMAMARPVVASRGAATGIGAQAGRHLLVADDDADFADGAVRLLTDPALAQRLGVQARQFVVEHCSWSAAMADLGPMMGFPSSGKSVRRDAA